MAILAIALLKGRDLRLPDGLSVKALDDAALVSTELPFGGDLEELAAALEALFGAAPGAERDPRGCFVIPDVVKPSASTYDGVIEEIGEAGEWVPRLRTTEPATPFGASQAGDLATMMGQVMGALGGDAMTQMAQALANGDTASLMAMQEKVVAALGGQERAEALGKQMLGAVQAESPGAVAAMQAKLAGLGVDAQQVAGLAQQVEKKKKGE